MCLMLTPKIRVLEQGYRPTDTLDTTNPPQGEFVAQRGHNIESEKSPGVNQLGSVLPLNISILPERFNSISEPKLGGGSIINRGLEISLPVPIKIIAPVLLA